MEKTIKNGFRKSGVFPFDKNNVDYSKCISNRKIFVNPEENGNATTKQKTNETVLNIFYNIWAAIKKNTENLLDIQEAASEERNADLKNVQNNETISKRKIYPRLPGHLVLYGKHHKKEILCITRTKKIKAITCPRHFKKR